MQLGSSNPIQPDTIYLQTASDATGCVWAQYWDWLHFRYGWHVQGSGTSHWLWIRLSRLCPWAWLICWNSSKNTENHYTYIADLLRRVFEKIQNSSWIKITHKTRSRNIPGTGASLSLELVCTHLPVPAGVVFHAPLSLQEFSCPEVKPTVLHELWISLTWSVLAKNYCEKSHDIE